MAGLLAATCHLSSINLAYSLSAAAMLLAFSSSCAAKHSFLDLLSQSFFLGEGSHVAEDTVDAAGGSGFFTTDLSLAALFLTLSTPSCHVQLTESCDLGFAGFLSPVWSFLMTLLYSWLHFSSLFPHPLAVSN